MNTYTVHFQKGWRVGARSLSMIRVEAQDEREACRKAKTELLRRDPTALRTGYRLTRVDMLDN
jgi:hypothetical protein